jgi:hypothetical protein
MYRTYCIIGTQQMLVGTDLDLKEAYKRCVSIQDQSQWHIKLFLPVQQEFQAGADECLISYTDPTEGEKKISFIIRATKQD